MMQKCTGFYSRLPGDAPAQKRALYTPVSWDL